MKRYGGLRFNSRWDWSTWMILTATALCCVVCCFIDDGVAPIVITAVMVLFVILAFKGIYYRIDGKQLIVYQMFIPRAYPIDRIRDIKPTKLALSAPATSLRHRLAITFDDPKVLKGRLPLIISPVRQSEFIAILKVINPDITVG